MVPRVPAFAICDGFPGVSLNGSVTAMAGEVLTNQHCECLNEALRLNAEAREIIEKCKRAGLPVDQIESDCKEQYEKAAGIKREFFPNRP